MTEYILLLYFGCILSLALLISLVATLLLLSRLKMQRRVNARNQDKIAALHARLLAADKANVRANEEIRALEDKLHGWK